MKFPTLRCIALLFGLVLCVQPATAVYDWDPQLQQHWTEKLAEAHAEVEASADRLDQARAVYTEARHERHPRGPELAVIEQDLADARRDVEDAEQTLDGLLEEARRAGVLPEVLRPYR